MTDLERDFLQKMYKAVNTKQLTDYVDATHAGWHLYNESRSPSDDVEEAAIATTAAEKYSQT